MVADIVADMEVDMVDDMVADMVADMVPDMVAEKNTKKKIGRHGDGHGGLKYSKTKSEAVCMSFKLCKSKKKFLNETINVRFEIFF